MRKIRGRRGVFRMAFSYDFCATRILNISRPSGWLDGQKHLRCRCSLPLLTLGTILASRPACVATTAHHPKMASAAALAGALNRIAVSAKPTAKKTNVVATKVRLRRATHHPIHSVQGYRVSSTADTSRRRHLRRMRSGLRCARLGRSRWARALSMRVTSIDRFSGRVAIARGDRNVVIARHPLSSRWWLVNARGFLRRADPNPYPPLPALTIQAFNARALRSGPRDLTVRLRFTARENPGGERVQATIPPPPGVPPPATCPVTKPEPMVFGRKISPGYAFQPPRCAGAARALVDVAARQLAEQTRYGVPSAFSSRDLRRMRARRPESRGLRGHHLPRLVKVQSLPPTEEKKTRVVI